MTRLISLLALFMFLAPIVAAEEVPAVTTPADRASNGPVYQASKPLELGNGVTLNYAYISYDNLTARLFGELEVAGIPDDVVVPAPYLYVGAEDENGKVLDRVSGLGIPSVVRAGDRAPFVASIESNGFQLDGISLEVCTSSETLKPDLIGLTDVAISQGGYGISSTFQLTNTSQIDLTEPVTNIAMYRTDGLFVGYGYGFYPGTVLPGDTVEDEINGASWTLATGSLREPLPLDSLVFEPTSYAANVPRAGECTGTPIAVTLIDSPTTLIAPRNATPRS